MSTAPVAPLSVKPPPHPFRRAVLRGLAVVLPPLLTVVIFLWVWGTLDRYILQPVVTITRTAIVHAIWDAKTESIHDAQEEQRQYDGRLYHRVGQRSYIPDHVFVTVINNLRGEPAPTTTNEFYHRYVTIQYLKPHVVIPVFLCVFTLLMYLVGKFMAAGVGRFFWTTFERGIGRLPLVRNVYSSVKQVTDFVFTDSEIQYTRIVAVEYPRLGTWSIGFVTGESLIDLHCAANEPVISVLIPTSPAPVTGYTVVFRKSETVDLDMTIDQAFQYIVSCGVVVAPQQLPNAENFARLNRPLPPSAGGNGDEQSLSKEPGKTT